MKFIINAQTTLGETAKFTYDNATNELYDENGLLFTSQNTTPKNWVESKSFSKENPVKKSRKIKLLKIQLGLSCNYACEYCSQAFVTRPPETSKREIEQFIKKLDNLQLDQTEGLKIEFWGGEPFVYVKTLTPLVDAIDEYFSGWERKPIKSVITNGSLLTDEICDWLFDKGFSVGLSHDGPGQSVRGPDPFDDPELKDRIVNFYHRMHGRMSFNSMLNRMNTSRKDIYDYFVDLTGDEHVRLGEGTMVDSYDDSGAASSLSTKAEHFAFRQKSFNDIRESDGQIGFSGILQKIDSFTQDVLTQRPASSVGQKCGMDRDDSLAVDLHGNVLTCQNVSAVETAPNGASHKIGTLDDPDNIVLNTSTHWQERSHCSSCPVLHVCKGSCMFLLGKNWEISCSNAYSDNVALFALSFEAMTGFIPTFIEGEGLPLDRADIWGRVLTHTENRSRRIIPIKETR